MKYWPLSSLLKNREDARETRFVMTFVCLLIALILMSIVSISSGRYSIPFMDVVKILLNPIFNFDATWNEQASSIIYTLRLPRVLAAILIGASLSISGASYQSVFKNPLVAPDMLGVASGACVGAAIAILAGAEQVGIQIGAFCGGLAAVTCAVMIPRSLRENTIVMLVHAGIIVSGLANSILGFIKYMADADTQLPVITYWQLGSLVSVVWDNIFYNGIPIVLTLVFIMAIRWRMNILTLSEEEAHMLGTKNTWLRYAIILSATILTACSVCISGTIGWIGLIIPHFSRMLVGPNNRKMLPIAAVLGAVFLLVVDTISRASIDAEVPLSILTGLIGAPFYFYLLLKQRRSM